MKLKAAELLYTETDPYPDFGITSDDPGRTSEAILRDCSHSKRRLGFCLEKGNLVNFHQLIHFPLHITRTIAVLKLVYLNMFGYIFIFLKLN